MTARVRTPRKNHTFISSFAALGLALGSPVGAFAQTLPVTRSHAVARTMTYARTVTQLPAHTHATTRKMLVAARPVMLTKGAFVQWAMHTFAHRTAKTVRPFHFADVPFSLAALVTQAIEAHLTLADHAQHFGFSDRVTQQTAVTGLIRMLGVSTKGLAPLTFAKRSGWITANAPLYATQAELPFLAARVRQTIAQQKRVAYVPKKITKPTPYVTPYALPGTPASGELVFSIAPTTAALTANKSLRQATIAAPAKGVHPLVDLTSVFYNPALPQVYATGHVVAHSAPLTSVWVEINESGDATGQSAQWIYDVPVAANGSFSVLLHVPFPADTYQVQAAPPLTTKMTSLTYTFDTAHQSVTAPFTLTYSGQDSDQQLGMLASAWANWLDPSVQALAKQITAGAATPLAKAQAVYTWEMNHIGYNGPLLKNGGYGWSTTEETLATRSGICVDYANVADAMLRALGIPTEMVVGYANDAASPQVDNGNTGHAWNRSWISGAWVYFDPTWSREYILTSAGEQYPGPGDLFLTQPQWFNPPASLLNSTHQMLGIQDQ
ncbi:transglutaminase domain-containing protein [Ferroacidibacillus organovorans]|uniref:Transglutaminase-like domain-containing protein n=1 Tax=Ferroacidibacillus organovorans TaxID=1765683 RepID=A0A853KBM9_9BACL|nr:transglutaminase-like domain-containing protein [Ferroacidibacillus organovorans]KYP81696.1 hypothetical protein AYJ22_06140 [Ferroacidibacillus organovorans]OAG94233.1 hypothetical protein AYW79_06350 [Ferroacidibacillus organovorans]